MSADTPKINDALLGEKLIRFGIKYIHIPNLMKNYLSMRTENKKYVKSKPAVPISNELKNIFVDMLYKNKFDANDYYKLKESEQKLFDDTCNFAGVHTHNIAQITSHTSKERNELISKFNVLRGELLAGNNAPELLPKMRNILLELKAKNLISKSHYDKLINEIIACM